MPRSPPWPRDLYGELVEKLRALGAKTIVFSTHILQEVGPVTDRVVITRPPVDKGIDPEEIRPLAEEYFSRVELAPENEEVEGLLAQQGELLAGKAGAVPGAQGERD